VTSFRDPSAPEVEILLQVTGGMEDLALTLGSEPTMETADILSYLATGRPAESAVQFGGAPGQEGSGGPGGVVGVGASLAIDRAAQALEGFAAESTGLDVVEIRQQGRGATFVAGRYVSPRLFVGFQQPLSFGSRGGEGALGRTGPSTEVQLEYSAFDWLLVNLRGGQSTMSFFLRTKHAF
jgi:translocation and assembly module TamB